MDRLDSMDPEVARCHARLSKVYDSEAALLFQKFGRQAADLEALQPDVRKAIEALIQSKAESQKKHIPRRVQLAEGPILGVLDDCVTKHDSDGLEFSIDLSKLDGREDVHIVRIPFVPGKSKLISFNPGKVKEIEFRDIDMHFDSNIQFPSIDDLEFVRSIPKNLATLMLPEHVAYSGQLTLEFAEIFAAAAKANHHTEWTINTRYHSSDDPDTLADANKLVVLLASGVYAAKAVRIHRPGSKLLDEILTFAKFLGNEYRKKEYRPPCDDDDDEDAKVEESSSSSSGSVIDVDDPSSSSSSSSSSSEESDEDEEEEVVKKVKKRLISSKSDDEEEELSTTNDDRKRVKKA